MSYSFNPNVGQHFMPQQMFAPKEREKIEMITPKHGVTKDFAGLANQVFERNHSAISNKGLKNVTVLSAIGAAISFLGASALIVLGSLSLANPFIAAFTAVALFALGVFQAISANTLHQGSQNQDTIRQKAQVADICELAARHEDDIEADKLSAAQRLAALQQQGSSQLAQGLQQPAYNGSALFASAF